MRFIYLLHCCFDGHHWYCTLLHSKNGDMKFIPNEYDIHPNEFHTYGMNSACILATVRSSYCGCEKAFLIPKLRVHFTPRWQTALLGQRSSKSVEGNLFMRSRNFYTLKDASEGLLNPWNLVRFWLKSLEILTEILKSLLKSEIWNLKTLRNLVI